MKYLVVFWCVTAVCVYNALMLNGWALLLIWPGISFGLVGLAYGGLGPAVFGKHADGSLGALSVVVLLPYLVYTWLLWHVWRLCTRAAPYQELCPGIKIGRRLLAYEFPKDVEAVFDLTSEFPEPADIRDGKIYRCYPTLDARPLLSDALTDAARNVLAASGDVYIHCANGHGRTGTLAVAVLLLSDECKNVEDAVDYAGKRRPGLRLNKYQLASVTEFARGLGRQE